MKAGRSLQDLAIEIERQVKSKKDYIADLSAVTMVADDGVTKLHIEGTGDNYGVRDIAHRQIAEHVKIDGRYYDRMRREAPELLATNVDHWFRKFPAPRMFRTLAPLTSTSPVNFAPSMKSRVRLMVLSRVVLPELEGPMMPMTELRGTSKLMLSSTCLRP